MREITTDDQYFPELVPSFLPLKNEIFVDGGAFDGDTIRGLMKLSEEKGVYKHIYAFEPDPQNYLKLRKFVSDYPNITCYKKGLYSRETTLEFLSGAGMESSVNEFVIERDADCRQFETINIEVCSIDNVVKDRVTYIKMDIEGSEIEALRGGENTIRRYKPKLAISIYHNTEDLWEIPLYIKEIVPDYKLYVEHHLFSLDCYDTVLYALI